ncbi:MAG: Mu transposase C-terminal domain-containing protein [Armatimonadetes bacterium]|nr:Mu transposase C-terminal domain-containing protein [Armatimonadota bacterium]
MARICGKLGIRLSHSRPYRPAGRGKIERLFRFMDTSFKPEAYEQIKTGKIATLDQLNDVLAAWVDGYYHRRKHGATGQTPLERVLSSQRQPRRVTIDELNDIFLWEEERMVDKTGCIHLHGNTCEVDLELVGKKVLLRYDPFDLKTIQVWHNEKRYHDAVPVELSRTRHRRAGPDRIQEPGKNEDAAHLSFFDAADKSRREVWEKEPLTFAREAIRNE